MKLSVIIVSYNTKKLTSACIESVVKKTKKLKYEIIVVDNGSDDGSVAAIKKLKIKNKKSKLKLIKNRTNLGFAKASNQGIKVAKGEYILLLNSDTLILDSAIEKLLNFAQATPDVGVVGPKLKNKDGSVQGSVFKFPTLIRALRQYWLGEKNLLNKYAPTGTKPTCVETLVMAAFLITPKALKSARYLNEKYFMYFEDLDYCREILKLGLKVYYLPSAEVIHLHGASGEKIKGLQKKRLVESSKIYHGALRNFLLNFIIWSGKKWQNCIRS